MVALVKGRPFFDEHGIAYRFSGTMEDVTEKVRLRKVLAENERNLRNLVEQAPVAMCVLKGPRHIVEIVNEKMVDLWGKNYCDVMGRPLFEALPEVHGQGLEELLNQVYDTGERYIAQERPVRLPRGKKLEVVYQNFVYEPLIGANGAIEGVIAVTIDVTEQVMSRRKVEEAEERARLATEGANLGTFDFDLIKGTTIVSQRYLDIFDLDSHTSHADKVKRIHPEDLHIRNHAHDEALVTGRLFYEVRIVRRDGQTTWVHIEGKVIKDNTGLPARIVGTALDITEKKLYDKQREEYIAIASHELRNPLTSLKLALDLMSENLPRPEQAEILEKCRNQVKRLITMTSELLNVSKISSGVLDLKPEVINVKHVIDDSIITAQAGIHTNDITVTGTPDINVRADKFRIEQVLVNLLSNASKYSPEHSPIVVNVTTTPSEVKVKVIDKGIGIDANKIGAIFKKILAC
ncbi:MAG: PAS domain-containing sensor histidine kinase [Chitinophagaceae bacterium]|nr:PAS domain-containing sensor histidine kinase [Chitinophagaceae bacterium]